jgi:multicomponent Na+:H+ antiporter subunit D
MNSLIPLFVVLPLATAIVIIIFGRLLKAFEKALPSAVLLFLTGLSFYFILTWDSGIYKYVIGGREPVGNIPISIYFVLDGLSILMLCIINLIGFLSGFYSISYIKRFTGENKYYALFCLMITGMNGVVLSGDIFNLYVFLEMAAISSYALVAFEIEKDKLEASYKYQVLGCLSSFFILLNIALLYWYTKSLNIADISRILEAGTNKELVIFIQILFIAGFGLKAALIPFHAWLPDAHSSAPSPISSMLSGVLIKAIGIYAIIRLFFNMFAISYEIALLITVIGTLSMVIGVLLAIGQWDMKRLLAYHSISQMGYVIIGVGIGMLILSRDGDRSWAALSIAGGLFHLTNHAVFKGLLFLNAGAVEYTTGTRNLKELGGLSGSMPVTSSTSLSASMSISGIPPFNGFFSKLIIIIAAAKAQYYLLTFLAITVSIITLASFLKVQKKTFYGKSVTGKLKNIKEVPFTMCFSMIVLAILCIALSLLIIPGIRETIIQNVVYNLVNKANYLLILKDI